MDSVKAGNVNLNQTAQAAPMQMPTPSIAQRGMEVERVLMDTRDGSGMSEKMQQVFTKDWSRFASSCRGEEPAPLPMEEANDDMFDYVGYMMKYGDKIQIGSTGANMKDIVSSNMSKAKEASGGDGFKFVTNLAHGIAQDPRIPTDYCFLRQPAEELVNSACAFMQAPQ